MTIAERNNKLKHFIICLKCEVSGKCCDDNCSTQYEAGTMGEIIENLEAISKVLEQEPTAKNDLGVDCISRADARKAIIDHQYSDNFCEEHDIDHSINTGMALIALSELPSVTPQPREGHWIDDTRLGYHVSVCSNCNWRGHGDTCLIYKPKYCPNCGCAMVEPQESEG